MINPLMIKDINATCLDPAAQTNQHVFTILDNLLNALRMIKDSCRQTQQNQTNMNVIVVNVP